ncbi:MAG: rRNA maturation RNase YbeY [Phycisphaerae bacterium]|nr:rRNA maturation RNase YbeY [Phycisphaerae bacterium]
MRRVAFGVAAAEGLRQGQLSITVVGQHAMSTLHERHLGESGPTDVLSFDLGSDVTRGLLDAEIVVCADVARRHERTLAAARRELALYVAHGILHIAGYDDHAPADFKRMHAREDELLTQLGLGAVFGQSGQTPRATRRKS